MGPGGKKKFNLFQGLPKTSYYKFIDYWLLFSLNMLVFSMGFHTYLASVVAQARNRDLRLFGKDRKERVRLKRTQASFNFVLFNAFLKQKRKLVV